MSKVNSTYIKREYRDVPFLLSPSNLARICEILEKRYDQLDKHESTKFEFSLRLNDTKQIVLDNLESVLALDNRVNNRIRELAIDYSRKKNETNEYVKIRFNGTPLWPGIAVTGESTNSIWLNETVAELEEQIERTILDDLIYKVKNESVFFGLLLLVLISKEEKPCGMQL